MGIESPNTSRVETTKTEEEKYRDMLSATDSIQELERLEWATNNWLKLLNDSKDGVVEIQGLGKRTKEQMEKRLQMIQQEMAKRQSAQK